MTNEGETSPKRSSREVIEEYIASHPLPLGQTHPPEELMAAVEAAGLPHITRKRVGQILRQPILGRRVKIPEDVLKEGRETSLLERAKQLGISHTTLHEREKEAELGPRPPRPPRRPKEK